MNKNFILFILLGLVYFNPRHSYATVVGNDVLPAEKGKWKVRLENEFVFSRRLKQRNGTSTIRETKSRRNYLKFIFGPIDNLDVFVKIGAATSKLDTQDGGYGFSWGAGFHSKLLQFPPEINVGLSGAFLEYRNNRYSNVLARDDSRIDEWQIALVLSKRYGKWMPYTGVKFSDMLVDVNSSVQSFELEAEDNFGVFVGTEIYWNQDLEGFIEGRFLDETSMSFSIRWRFWNTLRNISH